MMEHLSLIFFFVYYFLVVNLAEKQKRLQEVESIKEDAAANYVRFTEHVHVGLCLSPV